MEALVFAAFSTSLALAELVTAYANPLYGLSIHALLFATALALSTLRSPGNPASSLFLSLSLAPLVRIVSLSLPLAYFPPHTWHALAGALVLASAITLMRVEGLGLRDAGITFSKPFIQIAVGAAGPALGFIEYYILKPEPLTMSRDPLTLVILALSLVFFTGFVEELVFRGIMQRSAVNALGEAAGLFGTTTVFAILHIGWLSLLDLAFVFLVGLFYGSAVLKTGSIMGASISHGLTNVVLFIVMPVAAA